MVLKTLKNLKIQTPMLAGLCVSYACLNHTWCLTSSDFRYKFMLQIVVDVMKKFIQIAKPKTRRYFIQDEILKPLFLKV